VEGSPHGALKITPRDPSTPLRAAQDDGCGNAKTILITFWVVVPAKTKPRDFFQFLQQQGYLRIWLNGDIIRVDSDAKLERLGARVQVIQDRIVVSEENRARLTEAIETALRFGKGKINVISFPVEPDMSPAISKTAADTAAATGHEHPFSTGSLCIRLSTNCPRPIRILSLTVRNVGANTPMTITRTIAGTESAVSFAGSNRRLTKCTSASCSVAIVLM